MLKVQVALTQAVIFSVKHLLKVLTELRKREAALSGHPPALYPPLLLLVWFQVFW